MVTLLWLSAAWAIPPLCGEKLSWSIHYLGIHAGDVHVETSPLDAETLKIEVTATSAPWYAVLYNVEDQLISHWTGENSLYHETHFREGRFWQDQTMHLNSEPFTVERKQLIDGVWKTWTNAYHGLPPMEDPVTVLYRLRAELPQNQDTLFAFSGKQKTALYVRPIDRIHLEHGQLGAIEVQQYHLFSSHSGSVAQRGNMTMAFTTDSARIPVSAHLQSTIGAIRAELTQATIESCNP